MILGSGQREHRIWVTGFPKSQQSGSAARYREAIQAAAQSAFASPLTSSQIEVEIVFADKKRTRPDVDNIVKPVLDALKGIVYFDDAQVVSSTATVIPVQDDLRMVDGRSHNTYARLLGRAAQKVIHSPLGK